MTLSVLVAVHFLLHLLVSVLFFCTDFNLFCMVLLVILAALVEEFISFMHLLIIYFHVLYACIVSSHDLKFILIIF